MNKILFLLFWSAIIPFASNAQTPDAKFLLGYYNIKIKPTGKQFLSYYQEPGKRQLCGFFSKYNSVFYVCGGGKLKVTNTDFVTSAAEICCDSMVFNDGPKPYAMMELPVQIENVDYETNTIIAKTDGAIVEIETFNKEIDAFYNANYRNKPQFGPVRLILTLRNWSYEGESTESYAQMKKSAKPRKKFKGKRAKVKEEYLHDSEYMKY
jgi:hypothetical protein